MLKVFLVEDEVVIRESIKNNIEWEKVNLEFVGEASDGELAFPMIQKLKPDIMITDIKMPFMDGLELSRLVKKELPNIKIIILSGYNEFTYAKEAINIGVTEYLLKPISSIKLLEALQEVVETIERENLQDEYVKKFQQEMLEHKQIEKQKFFSEMIFKELSITEIMERAESLGMNLVAQNYNIVLFKVMLAGESAMTYSEEVVQMKEELEKIIEKNENIYMFDRAAEGWAFLIKGDGIESFQQKLTEYGDKLLALISKHTKVEYFGGVGKIVQRLRELPESFDEANKAFSYRYMGKTNQIIKYTQVTGMRLIEEDTMDITSFDVGKMDRTLLDNFLKRGSVEEVRNFIEDYFEGMGKSQISSLLFRQYVAMDMYFCTISFIEELGMSSGDIVETCGDFREAATIAATIDKTKQYLESLIKYALETRDCASQKRYGDMLKRAKDYIKENYAKENISLNSVAAGMNVSPSYFSTIFSQETGETFIEHLTTVRMEKAKELLMCSNMRISDIGYEVGYKDSHYFSYLFKKLQDCTPKEFRMRGKDKD